MLSNHKRRAKEYSTEVDYDLDTLRKIVREKVGKPCGFCGIPIEAKTFSLDHALPVSRGGSHGITNLVVCCLRCNQIKGDMTTEEFKALLQAIAGFEEKTRRNILARLRSGGRFMHN